MLRVEMGEPSSSKAALPKRRGPPEFFAPPPPPLRRPPGPLKLGPSFCMPIAPSETIRFRFRTRTVHATATFVDELHQNVLRLRLQPSIVQQFLRVILARLPSSIKTWFEVVCPEWNLPSQLILKKQKEGWDEEFETEKAAYARLQPLQGIVIPKCFGQLGYNNARALLLSDIGGACLAAPEGALLEVAEFRRMLCQALTVLAQFRILQDDVKLDNFHLTGDRIMVVDLERLRQGLMSDEELALDIKSAVGSLVDRYEDNQYCFWEDGLIEIDAANGTS